jgi:hypothetical protein
MKRRDLFEQFKHGVLVVAFLLSGCATTMQMSSEELKRATPNEGIVVGSIQIKGGEDILGRKKWELLAESIKGASLAASLLPSGSPYAIQASRDEEEEVFVARMPAGDYRFWKLYQPGFSTLFAMTNIQFKVQPGKTIYIGRVVIEFPPGLINVFKKFQIRVENARALTLDVGRKKYGLSGDDVTTDLMTTRLPN